MHKCLEHRLLRGVFGIGIISSTDLAAKNTARW
jgi:hypothetical protein